MSDSCSSLRRSSLPLFDDDTASLGYLLLWVQPPTPTCGSIIQDGRGVLDRAPWAANSAGVIIFLLVITIQAVW